MTHLGERLNALVDGELDHDERDRALVHLAVCEFCRTEAEALRRLKRRLRSFSEVVPSSDLMARLYAMGEPGGPLPPSVRALPGQARPPTIGLPGRRRPADNRPGRSAWRLPRARYLAVGAATLAVFGVGAASFAAGAEPGSLPRVTPAVEKFGVEHALMAGDVPLTDHARGTSGHP